MSKCENCQRYNSGTCSKDLNKKECNYIEINSTLEEVKKEWEELGYSWEEKDAYIKLTLFKNPFNYIEIYINKISKLYTAVLVEEKIEYPLAIDLEYHNLLTKTFKALGWI